ncbi:MAG: DUF1540 domain-containing protein [Longimicrobiales bacterium]
MAEAQKKQAAGGSVVASCTATDCRHNENEECHAGRIVVRMQAGGATCGTYEPAQPKPRP